MTSSIVFIRKRGTSWSDIQIFEGTINMDTGLAQYKMDPYYELVRLAKKDKSHVTNVPLNIYGVHNSKNKPENYESDLSDEELFLKAAFIQQISDGKIIVESDIGGLSDKLKEKGINWRKILG